MAMIFPSDFSALNVLLCNEVECHHSIELILNSVYNIDEHLTLFLTNMEERVTFRAENERDEKPSNLDDRK